MRVRRSRSIVYEVFAERFRIAAVNRPSFSTVRNKAQGLTPTTDKAQTTCRNVEN